MITNDFFGDGYAIVPQLLDSESTDTLKKAIANYLKVESTGGIRDIHNKILEIKNITTSELIFNTLKQYAENS